MVILYYHNTVKDSLNEPEPMKKETLDLFWITDNNVHRKCVDKIKVPLTVHFVKHGSQRTLTARFKHASRTVGSLRISESGERVSIR